MPDLCTRCAQEIAPGSPVAHGRTGRMHFRCFKLGTAHATVVDEKTPTRDDLLAALKTMPEEAFGWFVAWCLRGYPDGLGGFKPESRDGIERLQQAARDYLENRT